MMMMIIIIIIMQRLRYDTKCYFNVRSKADMSQLNLPHWNGHNDDKFILRCVFTVNGFLPILHL